MGYTFKRPDPAAMERILTRFPYSPEGAILRLAWLEGLSREEIAALTWDQVQFEDNALTLPDRTVPLAPSAEDCLRERHRLYAQRDPHVIISDRYQRPMPPESVSRLARTALDTEGQKVSLKDLRQDFVIRQLQTHDWTYAARVSGMAVSTLRGSFSQYFQERQSAAPELPPDSEYLLWRIVQQEGSSVVGLALWMGWKLQMQPGEILNLTWSQVDLDRSLLRLPDREIPMGSRLSRLLGDVYDHRKDPAQDRVLLTPGTGKPMDLARLSTVIRTALIRGGLEQLSLGDLSRLSRRGSQRQTVLARLSAVGSLTREEVMDLHHDFVIRQLQTHDWPYVARVSGMAVSTLRDAFSPYLTKPAAPENPLAQRDEAEYLLWRVIQQEGSSPAGLALWMGWKLQMQPGEIASLTWGQVDFDQNLIRLPDRTVSMGSRLRRLLLDAWDRRKDPAEPRVFTAPTTGRPMDLSRLTTVTRTALIRGGLEHVNLRNLHTWVRQGDRAQLLMAQAEEQGWLTREAVMERLGVSKSTARQYLLELREAGRLVRVGTRYYPAGAVADPDDHLDIIRAYLQEHGIGRRQDFIRLLGLEPEQGTLLLRRLTDRGELVLTGRHYTLPEQEK